MCKHMRQYTHTHTHVLPIPSHHFISLHSTYYHITYSMFYSFIYCLSPPMNISIMSAIFTAPATAIRRVSDTKQVLIVHWLNEWMDRQMNKEKVRSRELFTDLPVFMHHSVLQPDLQLRSFYYTILAADQWKRKVTRKIHNNFPLQEGGNRVILIIHVMKRLFFEACLKTIDLYNNSYQKLTVLNPRDSEQPVMQGFRNWKYRD